MGLPPSRPPVEGDTPELRAPRPRPPPGSLGGLQLVGHSTDHHHRLRRRADASPVGARRRRRRHHFCITLGKELAGHDARLALGGKTSVAAAGDGESKDLPGARNGLPLVGDLDDDVVGDRTIVFGLGRAGPRSLPLLLLYGGGGGRGRGTVLLSGCLVQVPLASHPKAGAFAIRLDQNRNSVPFQLTKIESLFPFLFTSTDLLVYASFSPNRNIVQGRRQQGKRGSMPKGNSFTKLYCHLKIGTYQEESKEEQQSL